MAISSAICTSFKQEILVGTHNFTATSGDTFKIALYTSSATLGAGTTAYSTSNEITNSSGTAYTQLLSVIFQMLVILQHLLQLMVH